MPQFVAIDFETANEKRSSPCSVGVVVVRGGKATESFYTLIRPRECRFSAYNTSIHGITAEDVKDKPEFPEVWQGLRRMLDAGVVLAHNASFDMSVLRCTLAEYEMEFPDLTYSCTRIIAKAAWPGLVSYRLTMVARSLGIEFEHHHALCDAQACAEIACRACEETGSPTLDELAKRLGVQHGRICNTGEYYAPAVSWNDRGQRASSRIDVEAIRPRAPGFDTEHPFFGRVFAFTGSLQSMTRRQAMQAVVDVGGRNGNGVTKQTNFLVVGDQDYRKFAEGETKSSKMRKAEALLASGQDIEILTEDDLLQLLEL